MLPSSCTSFVQSSKSRACARRRGVRILWTLRDCDLRAVFAHCELYFHRLRVTLHARRHMPCSRLCREPCRPSCVQPRPCDQLTPTSRPKPTKFVQDPEVTWPFFFFLIFGFRFPLSAAPEISCRPPSIAPQTPNSSLRVRGGIPLSH